MSWQVINVVSMFLDQLAWPVVVFILGWRLCGTGRTMARAVSTAAIAIIKEVQK